VRIIARNPCSRV
jgi:uncharacterized membrane protein